MCVCIYIYIYIHRCVYAVRRAPRMGRDAASERSSTGVGVQKFRDLSTTAKLLSLLLLLSSLSLLPLLVYCIVTIIIIITIITVTTAKHSISPRTDLGLHRSWRTKVQRPVHRRAHIYIYIYTYVCISNIVCIYIYIYIYTLNMLLHMRAA